IRSYQQFAREPAGVDGMPQHSAEQCIQPFWSNAELDMGRCSKASEEFGLLMDQTVHRNTSCDGRLMATAFDAPRSVRCYDVDLCFEKQCIVVAMNFRTVLSGESGPFSSD